ncbi:MAG: hypothetical protein Q9M30_07595 [Mariprofundaceae bacterium]|nr:hypothetical protein [Mariprofundaceae bacterium]
MLASPILVVCDGNLCRSPFAEACLSRALSDAGVYAEVFSRGLLDIGNHPVPEAALRVAGDFGIDLSAHRSVHISPEDVQRAALVMVMSERQRRHLGRLNPAGIGKVFLLSQAEGGTDVPDPVGQSEAVFQQVYGEIRHLVDVWLQRFGLAAPG